MDKLFNITNTEDGTSAFVITNSNNGYTTIFRDDDSNNNIAIFKCKTFDQAKEKCIKLVNSISN